MARAAAWFSGLVVSLLLAPACPSTAAPARDASSTPPTYRPGDRWILDGEPYDLRRVEDGRYVFGAAERQIELGERLGIVKVVRRGIVEWEIYPPVEPSWPLKTGRWGVVSAILRTRDAPSGFAVEATWQVRAYEDVKVPAGVFKAYRVDYTIEPARERIGSTRPRGAGQQSWSLTTWYAPDVQRLVKAVLPGVDALDFELTSPSRTAAQPPAATPPPTASPAKPPASQPPAPLSIVVRAPEDGARLSAASSVVAGVVTSGHGVARVSVTLNGKEVLARREPAPQPRVVVSVPVTLREGTNAIVVSATDAGGAVRQELRTVAYAPRPAPAPPPAAPPAPKDRWAKGERWAVVIGIGAYEDPAIPHLRFSVADAELFYSLLTERAGFRKDHVLLLTDRTERRPTLRDLKYALGTFLARSAGKDDLVVIYYAGHGAPEVDPRGIESDGLAKYLVPIDANAADLYSTALPMDEFQTIFSRIEAERVVVFLDACYSGAAGGRTFASRRTRATRVDDLFLERLTRSRGRAIITAARSSEVSLELAELGHGLFTYYLVTGLRGAADLDLDGIVALQELYQYLEQTIARKSRAAGGNQHPVLKGELEGTLPLLKVSRP